MKEETRVSQVSYGTEVAPFLTLVFGGEVAIFTTSKERGKQLPGAQSMDGAQTRREPPKAADGAKDGRTEARKDAYGPLKAPSSVVPTPRARARARSRSPPPPSCGFHGGA